MFSHLLIAVQPRIPIAMLALTLAAVAGIATGPVLGSARPFFGIVMEALFGGIGVRLDKAARGPKDLIVRGVVIAVTGISFAVFVGFTMARISAKLPVHGVTEIVLLSLTMSSGAVWRTLLRLHAYIVPGLGDAGDRLFGTGH